MKTKAGFTLIELLVLIAIIAVCMGLGVWIGTHKERIRIKAEAVRLGVAHYEVDAKGESQCVWTGVEVVETNRTTVEMVHTNRAVLE